MNKLTSITLLIISFLAVTQFSQAQCNIDDWDALKALYDNTNGQNWTNRTGWDMLISGQTIPPNNCDLNTLYGVATEDGRVTCIDLDGKVDCVHSYNDGNNLDGTIPTELEKLSDLKQLVLANNKLEGSIPTELGNLTNLTIFNLHKNELTGSIPPELGNLTNLKFLALSENGFDGSIPVELYSLKTLKELYLKKNGLTGTISPEINNLTKMENLQLWSNALTGNLPVELCDLTNLNTLQIHHNDFTGCYPDCFNQFCGIASNFDIAYENEFDSEWEEFCATGTGSFPPKEIESCHIYDWTALKALYDSTNGDNWINRTGWDEQIVGQCGPPHNCDLNTLYGVTTTNGRVTCIDMDGNEDCFYSYNDGNNLDGILPSELGKLSHLTYLNLKDNQLSGSLPTELGSLTKLRELFLNNNQLSGSLPAELGNLTNLVSLFLSYNQFNSSVIAELGKLNNLEILVLDNNQLNGNLPVELGNLTKLRELFLYNNQLIGNLPAELGNLTNLVWMYLGNNQLTGSLPVELGNLTNLEILSLGGNQLSGSLPFQLGNLTNLEILVLDNNQLSDNLPVELGNLTKLRELFLYNNQLSGNLPAELGNLTNLVWMYLGNNQLNGSLPAELGNLTNLEVLSLGGGNRLSGSLPTQLGNLTNLRELYLDNNEFNGSLPAKISNLTNLGLLFLNNNQFSGSLPAELGDLTNLVWLFLSYNQFDGSLPAELCHLTNLTILSINENNLQGCYPACMNAFCVQLNDQYFYGDYDISNGNNFDATWEDFCETNEEGKCKCEIVEIEGEVILPTHYSGEVQVEVTLQDGQYILKNDVATVYDYNDCHNYNNLESCNPVKVCENNLAANEALWAVTKAAEYFSIYHSFELPLQVNIIVNNTNEPYIAKYNPTHNVILLGAGDQVNRKSMAAPDIVVHEYSHAVIKTLKSLGNYKITGALNESYADISAELIERYCFESSNDYPENNEDWVLGSQVMINKAGIRNISNPKDTAMVYQLSNTYNGENWLQIDSVCFHIDNCGVHTNSGVHSYWFYLLAFGGSGTNDNGQNFNITNAIGIENAAKIAFHNLKNYLNPQSTFIEVREGSICAAETLFGQPSEELTTTIEAWNAVGVFEVIENPIEFRITNAFQTDGEIIEGDKTVIPVQFDLSIDSLGMDISADKLCFTLHKPDTYMEMYIDKVYTPLDMNQLTIDKTTGEFNICINRLNNGITKKEGYNPLIASNSSILGFKVCIISEDIGGEDVGIAPVGISGFTKGILNEEINFRPATLPFGFDFNSGDIEPSEVLDISLKLNHKNCNTLGAIKIEVLDSFKIAIPPYTYTLKDSMDVPIVKNEPTFDTTYQFYNLEEGEYKVEVKDSDTDIVAIGSKKFSIDFVGEQTGSICCPQNLIIPPGNINGEFNSSVTISFSEGTFIPEGTFEICE